MRNGKELKEIDIQEFIAKFPWLLNIDYRNVPDLDKKRIEYLTKENKRIDLILKDYKTNCPVVVEFKLGKLTREAIGQILEYKARIFTHFNEEDELLYKIFGKNIFCPKLVLVVKTSDEYGRIACNLQNIELFEYKTLEEKVIEGNFPDIRRLKEFSESLNECEITISEDRNEKLKTNVYNIIEELFEKYNLKEKWRNYRDYDIGEWYRYKDMFLNKWLIKDEYINIAIYEELIFDKKMKVYVTFYSWNDNPEEMKQIKKKIKKLEKLIKSNNKYIQDKDEDIKLEESPDDEDYYECYLFQMFDNKIFFNNVSEIMEFTIANYIKVDGINL